MPKLWHKGEDLSSGATETSVDVGIHGVNGGSNSGGDRVFGEVSSCNGSGDGEDYGGGGEGATKGTGDGEGMKGGGEDKSVEK